MGDAQRFSAPWGKLLCGLTLLGVGVTLAALLGLQQSESFAGPYSYLATALLAGLLLGAPLFQVRGYRLEQDRLIVERLGWQTVIPLEELVRASHDPGLMKGALRIGNGGFFVFAGWYWSRRLGWFRLLGNDILGRPVLLEFQSRKWVITPDDPLVFVESVHQRLTMASP